MDGWIKLHRGIMTNLFWREKPFSRGQAWVDLLCLARFKDEKIVVKGQVVLVKRGSYLTSDIKLCERWGWSRNKVRAYLNLLEKEGMIEKKGTPLGTLVSLVNYGLYQDCDTPQGTPESTPQGIPKSIPDSTPLGTPEGTQNKNDKKEDKEKREEGKNNPPISPILETPYFENEELDMAFVNYMDYCRRRGAPVNDVDAEIIKRRLCGLAMGNDGVDIEKAIGIIEQTIANRWSGLFPLDKDKKKIAQKKTDDEEWKEILERRKNDE